LRSLLDLFDGITKEFLIKSSQVVTFASREKKNLSNCGISTVSKKKVLIIQGTKIKTNLLSNQFFKRIKLWKFIPSIFMTSWFLESQHR